MPSPTNGKEHYERAEAILLGIEQNGHEQDATWMLANATRALVHAQLAAAARDYGKHVEPREQS